ncbi:MAG TPA: hypothetical protein RMH99_31360 [Sandaracinaceae bacterium LLY-WYZ-13_1]|nr:hypothetical protein [Sandaracinaceae bacterium LLY-WYZ-13_1]
MRTETVPCTEGDDAFDAFVARPGGAGPRPAAWVCHAWRGRDDFAEANDPDFGTVYDADAGRRSRAEMRRFLEEVLG